MINQEITKSLRRKILLNPGPATTSVEVKSALLAPDICPREEEFGKLIETIKVKLLNVTNSNETHECVLLASSGTGAIESCLTSCLEEGKKVLIIENGAYGKRMAKICDLFEIPYELLSFDLNKRIDLSRISEFLKISQSRFGLFAFVHHETTTGILNDVKSLLSIAKEYQIPTMVDAMSSFGGVCLAQEINSIDYLIASSNKCIHGFAGISFVIIRKEIIETLKTNKIKSFYFNLYQNYLSQKGKGQFLFTPPVQTLYALDYALDEFFNEGGTLGRSAKYDSLYTLLYNGMIELGFVGYLDERENSKILTTFYEPELEGYSFEEMHDYFYKRDITIYPGKVGEERTFRLSNIGDITTDDITYVLENMKSYYDSKTN